MVQKQRSYDKTVVGGKLYLVPTPIGNLQDMTFRGIATLKEVGLIASEDTRTTQKLLNHFEVQTAQISLHEHNYQQRIPELLAHLRQGMAIAQVSDAGMPSISDPGHELVVACLQEGIPVISLPGATAGVTALIASGLPTEHFSFYGFLPRKKKEQLERLAELKNERNTLLFYESPYRVKTTFANLATVFGSEREAVLCRELSKLFEEYLRGTLGELAAYLAEHEIKGECCLIVSGADTTTLTQEPAIWASLSLAEHVEYLVSEEQQTSKEAIKAVAKIRDIKKQDVYKAFHQLSAE